MSFLHLPERQLTCRKPILASMRRQITCQRELDGKLIFWDYCYREEASDTDWGNASICCLPRASKRVRVWSEPLFGVGVYGWRGSVDTMQLKIHGVLPSWVSDGLWWPDLGPDWLFRTSRVILSLENGSCTLRTYVWLERRGCETAVTHRRSDPIAQLVNTSWVSLADAISPRLCLRGVGFLPGARAAFGT